VKAKEKGDGKSSRGSMKLSMTWTGIAVLLVLTAIAVTSLVVVPVIVAAQEAGVTVTVNAPEYVEEGETFVVTIDVDSVTDLNSAQFDLSFDPDVIEVNDVKEGEINGEKVPISMWPPIDAETVRVIIMMSSVEGVSGSGYLAEVEFRVNGDEGEVSVLDISEGELLDKKGASKELFSVDKKFKDELNDEKISNNLKETFDEAGYPLENPTVKVKTEDMFWHITDFPNRVYIVVAQSGMLGIRDKGEILANWIGTEVIIGVPPEEKDEEEEEEEEVGEEVIPGSLNITVWKPAKVVVSNAVGESRAFNISINQIADISWQINGTEVQTNESITEAVYTNTSAVVGTWNVSAIATNTTTGLSDTHTWRWSVTLTPIATVMPAPTLAPGVTPTPTLAPGETPKPTPTPTLAPKVTPKPTTPTPPPKPAGFEAMFAIVGTLAVAYILLRKR
jgi:hypothetical protein